MREAQRRRGDALRGGGPPPAVRGATFGLARRRSGVPNPRVGSGGERSLRVGAERAGAARVADALVAVPPACHVPAQLLGQSSRELLGGTAGLKSQLKRGEGRDGQLKAAVEQLAGVTEHLVRRSLKHNLAGTQHHHAVGREGLIHEVGDVNDGGARLVQVAKHTHDAAAAADVEHGARLIEHEHVGVHGQRARDGDALLLAAREASRVGLSIGTESHTPQLGVHAPDDLVAGDAEVLRAKGHVVCHDARDDLVLGVLEHQARAVTGGPVGLGVHLAVVVGEPSGKLDAPGVGCLEARKQLGERGLARAVAAKHAQPLAGAHREVNAVEGPGGALVIGKADALKQGPRRRRFGSCAQGRPTSSRAWRRACRRAW